MRGINAKERNQSLHSLATLPTKVLLILVDKEPNTSPHRSKPLHRTLMTKWDRWDKIQGLSGYWNQREGEINDCGSAELEVDKTRVILLSKRKRGEGGGGDNTRVILLYRLNWEIGGGWRTGTDSDYYVFISRILRRDTSLDNSPCLYLRSLWKLVTSAFNLLWSISGTMNWNRWQLITPTTTGYSHRRWDINSEEIRFDCVIYQIYEPSCSTGDDMFEETWSGALTFRNSLK